MTAVSVDQYSEGFEAQKPNFTIINRDGDSALARGLHEYLSRHGVEVPLEDDKETLQDATFYHASDYIAILPEGYSKAFLTDSPLEVQTITTPASAAGYYADSLANQFLSLTRAYRMAEPSMSEETAVGHALDDLGVQSQVDKKVFGSSQPVSEIYEIYYRMGCYILLVLVVLTISTVLLVFRRPDLRMRNLCSPLRPHSMNAQMVLCGGVVSIAAWLLYTIVGFLIYGNTLSGADWRIVALCILNSLVFLLVALSIAMLCSTFVRGSSAQNAVANFVGLSLCFLGGVFVPLEMLGNAMLAVAKFMPTYWYITALTDICDLTSITSASLTPIWQAMLVQLAFAAALLCVALVVGKVKGQSEQSFGRVSTEMEA